MDSVTNFRSGGYGRNIDNRTGANPQGSIGTITPETNSERNCDIFNSVSSTLDLAYRKYLGHGTAKSKNENRGGNNIFENAERKNNF